MNYLITDLLLQLEKIKTEKPIELGLVVPKHLELAEKLIHHVYEDSLKLGVSIMTDIQNLFKVGFKSKSNVS